MSPKVLYIPSKRTEPGKNVGIYCRVSSGEKNQLYSLSAQISALTKAVANVDQWKLADVFIDIASARQGLLLPTCSCRAPYQRQPPQRIFPYSRKECGSAAVWFSAFAPIQSEYP